MCHFSTKLHPFFTWEGENKNNVFSGLLSRHPSLRRGNIRNFSVGFESQIPNPTSPPKVVYDQHQTVLGGPFENIIYFFSPTRHGFWVEFCLNSKNLKLKNTKSWIVPRPGNIVYIHITRFTNSYMLCFRCCVSLGNLSRIVRPKWRTTCVFNCRILTLWPRVLPS